MKPRDFADLLLLAALWGGSYLFMRYAAPAFGAVPLIGLRVAIAAACLLPLLLWHGHGAALRRHAGPVAVMGLLNSGLPFLLIAWAMLSVSAGFAAILNASTPIFTALVGALWLGERLDRSRIAGLLLGFAGVLLLSADKADFKPGGTGWAVLALLGAAFSYGVAANFTRRWLADVPSLVNATGSQLASTLLVLPLVPLTWPAQPPGALAWGAVLTLGVACTALAYVMFFRLMGRVGASRTVTVTYLVPVFGATWGALFLGEPVTREMLLGGAVILAGTALATGLVRWPRRAVA